MAKVKWEIIWENDDLTVEYDKENKNYRVSYFEDGHYKDEIIFVYNDVSKYQ